MNTLRIYVFWCFVSLYVFHLRRKDVCSLYYVTILHIVHVSLYRDTLRMYNDITRKPILCSCAYTVVEIHTRNADTIVHLHVSV